MNINVVFLVVAVCLAAVVVITTGCQTREEDPQLSVHRAEILLAQEPSESTSIEDAKKSLSDRSGAVTIEGQADLEAFEANGRNKALMLVREIISTDHGNQPGHDPSTCPFCKRRLAAAPKAAVEFVDEKGKVLPYAVEALFNLKQGDHVVVKGTAEIDEGLDIMKVTASGLHVRTRAEQ